jgi:hypothetical protein
MLMAHPTKLGATQPFEVSSIATLAATATRLSKTGGDNFALEALGLNTIEQPARRSPARTVERSTIGMPRRMSNGHAVARSAIAHATRQRSITALHES